MRRKILALMLLMLPLMATNAQNYTVAQVRQRINAATSRMSTMTCDFVQTKSLRMLKRKVVSHGKMYYGKPDKLRWEYTSPYHYTFILNGQTVRMKNSRGDNSVNVQQSKMFKEITRIMMGSVLGTCVSNNKDFNVSIHGQGNNWQAVMTPRRNPLKQMFSTITVYFDMRRSLVSSVKMTERNGDTTLITLKNIRTNTPIDAKVFSLR